MNILDWIICFPPPEDFEIIGKAGKIVRLIKVKGDRKKHNFLGKPQKKFFS